MKLFILLALAAYLIFNSYTDLKNNTISACLSAFFCISLVFIQIFVCKTSFLTVLFSLLPGLLLLLISNLTKQSIGYGDGIVILTTGIAIGFNYALTLLFLAFILSALFSLYLIMQHKSGKYTLPFVPFILVSYILTILVNL